MHLKRILLATICFYAFGTTNSFRRKIGKDVEIEELGDDITFYHRNHGLTFEMLGPRRRKLKRKVKSVRDKSHQTLKSRCSSKRCFPNLPYRHGYGSGYPPYLTRWWPRAPNPLWPEYGWVEGCGYPFGRGYGHGAWNHHFPTFPCYQSGCGHWCCKYNKLTKC